MSRDMPRMHPCHTIKQSQAYKYYCRADHLAGWAILIYYCDSVDDQNMSAEYMKRMLAKKYERTEGDSLAKQFGCPSYYDVFVIHARSEHPDHYQKIDNEGDNIDCA